jgi:hypothetical protein
MGMFGNPKTKIQNPKATRRVAWDFLIGLAEALIIIRIFVIRIFFGF